MYSMNCVLKRFQKSQEIYYVAQFDFQRYSIFKVPHGLKIDNCHIVYICLSMV